jgi:hypothetical protein|tara:strand:- start:27334 stop:27612 length:279 start_codon:yes stop_codon:yes gene_type:complete
MKDGPGPTLSYGMYDPPRRWGRFFGWIFFLGVLGGIGTLSFIASENHIDAALYAGKAGLEKKVVLKQTAGEETTITTENRKWLSNIASEGDK